MLSETWWQRCRNCRDVCLSSIATRSWKRSSMSKGCWRCRLFRDSRRKRFTTRNLRKVRVDDVFKKISVLDALEQDIGLGTVPMFATRTLVGRTGLQRSREAVLRVLRNQPMTGSAGFAGRRDTALFNVLKKRVNRREPIRLKNRRTMTFLDSICWTCRSKRTRRICCFRCRNIVLDRLLPMWFSVHQTILVS